MGNDYKKLVRSRRNRTICGVCGGIGEYLNVDPTLVRLAWVLFTALGSSGMVAYFICAIVIPREPW